jgi:hypothetical protein
VLTLPACAAYLQRFFTLTLREYRSLVRRNIPLLEQAIPRFGKGAAVLQAEIFPLPVQRGLGNMLWIAEQPFAVPPAAIRISWFTSLGSSEDLVLVRSVERPTHGFMEVPSPDPGAPRDSGFLMAHETVIDEFMHPDRLLDEVYEWLREDFRSVFGRELWGQ